MSCFGGHEEQIFLLELTVERLLLKEDKYREEFSCEPPQVKIKLMDFPVFVITRRPRDTCAGLPSKPYDEKEGLVYSSGKSVLFVMKPAVLVRAVQLKPMSIGIFRENETYPIAEGSAAISGCLCDQAAMSKNDEDHRPDPFEMYGTYGLCDVGKQPAGSIKLGLRLTFFGEYIISDFRLYQDSCIFKNNFDGVMRITKVKEEEEEEEDEDEGEVADGDGGFQMGDHTVLASLHHDLTIGGEKNET